MQRIAEYIGSAPDYASSRNINLQGSKTDRLIEAFQKADVTDYLLALSESIYLEEWEFLDAFGARLNNSQTLAEARP